MNATKWKSMTHAERLEHLEKIRSGYPEDHADVKYIDKQIEKEKKSK